MSDNMAMKLVGIVQVVDKNPSFALPIFRSSRNDNVFWTQKISYDEILVDFHEFDAPDKYITWIRDGKTVSVGEAALWAYMWDDGKNWVGTREELTNYFNNMGYPGLLAKKPFSMLQVAEFCSDTEQMIKSMKVCFDDLSRFSKSWARRWRNETIISGEIRDSLIRIMRNYEISKADIITALSNAEIDITPNGTFVVIPEKIGFLLKSDRRKFDSYFNFANRILELFGLEEIRYIPREAGLSKKSEKYPLVQKASYGYEIILYPIGGLLEEACENISIEFGHVHCVSPHYKGASDTGGSYQLVHESREKVLKDANRCVEIVVCSVEAMSVQRAINLSKFLNSKNGRSTILVMCDEGRRQLSGALIDDPIFMQEVEKSFTSRIIAAASSINYKYRDVNGESVQSITPVRFLSMAIFAIEEALRDNSAGFYDPFLLGWNIFSASAIPSEKSNGADAVVRGSQAMERYPFAIPQAGKIYIGFIPHKSEYNASDAATRDALRKIAGNNTAIVSFKKMKTAPENSFVCLLATGFDEPISTHGKLIAYIQSFYHERGAIMSRDSRLSVDNFAEFSVRHMGNSVTFCVGEANNAPTWKDVSALLANSQHVELPIIVATRHSVSRTLKGLALRRGVYFVNYRESADLERSVFGHQILVSEMYSSMPYEKLFDALKRELTSNISKTIEMKIRSPAAARLSGMIKKGEYVEKVQSRIDDVHISQNGLVIDMFGGAAVYIEDENWNTRGISSKSIGVRFLVRLANGALQLVRLEPVK